MTSQELAESVIAILTPLLGNYMAHASLQAHCELNNIAQDRLSAKDLPVIAEGIGRGLVCFLGRDRAQVVAAQIRGLAGQG